MSFTAANSMEDNPLNHRNSPLDSALALVKNELRAVNQTINSNLKSDVALINQLGQHIQTLPIGNYFCKAIGDD